MVREAFRRLPRPQNTMTFKKTFRTHGNPGPAEPTAGCTTLNRYSNPIPQPSIRRQDLRRKTDGGLERLREGMLAQTLAQVQSTALVRPIRRAAQEAAALAWMEEFPLLVFPCLFQEKVEAAKLRIQRQLWIEAQTSDFFETAA